MSNTWGSLGRSAVVWVVGVTSVLLGVLSILISLRSRYWYPRIYAFWVIAPPAWFFIEYHFIFDRKDDELALQQLQTGQDVAQKFWAALLVLLAGIGYFQWNLTLH
jgi:hypothetical protein